MVGLGPMTLTGFAVCAHTFVRINLYAQEHTRDSCGVLTANLRNKNELAARAFEGVSVLVLVLWWLSARLRRAAVLVGCWCRPRCCQLAKRAGAGVSWLRALWRRRKLAVRPGCVHSCSSQSHVNRSWDAA